jgi:hypothetical protein
MPSRAMSWPTVCRAYASDGVARQQNSLVYSSAVMRRRTVSPSQKYCSRSRRSTKPLANIERLPAEAETADAVSEHFGFPGQANVEGWHSSVASPTTRCEQILAVAKDNSAGGEAIWRGPLESGICQKRDYARRGGRNCNGGQIGDICC